MLEEAVSRPECRFNVNWNKDRPEETPFPQLYKMQALVRLSCLDAVVRAKNGDMAGSAKSLRLAYLVSDDAGVEPSFIWQLVRASCLANASRALQVSLDKGGLTEPQAKGLFEELGKIDLSPGYVIALKGDRVLFASELERIRKGQLSLDEISGPSDFANPFEKKQVDEKDRARRDEEFGLRQMDKMIANAHLPYREAVKKNAFLEHPEFPDFAIASKGFVSVYLKSRLRVDEGMAYLAGDRIVLALVTYKARSGKYPVSLQALEKELGWKLPGDMLTGRNFVYRPDGKGFLLYSFGYNLKDDGGAVLTNEEIRSRSMHQGYGYGYQQTGIDPMDYHYPMGSGRKAADIIWRRTH